MPAASIDNHHTRSHRRSPSSRPIPSTSGRALRGLTVAVLLAGLLSLVGVDATAGPAGAAGGSGTSVVITGRGWGHGRGMGQYGALGYARDSGWTSTQILDHYYGGTSTGPAPSPGVVDPNRVRVDLVAMRGRATTVALADGTLHLMAADGSTLTRITGAVRLTLDGSRMQVATGPGCDGPWTAAAAIDQTLIRVAPETTAAAPDGLLQACGPSYRNWYDGELWATGTNGSPRTVNLVSVEQYLRGVVPNEVPASWPQATLEAQAVAARSYALAGDTRWPGYADTCDSTTCQVYDGRFTTRSGYRSTTHPRTDAAIAATAGLVRLEGDHSVARTEFSSSTGGWTAGGDFPAVRDEGDATASNPNSRWETTVDLAGLEATYGRGAIVGIGVVERNGLGSDGGRVEKVELRFTRGSVVITGDRLRRHLGLKSNWFSIGTLTRDGVVQEPIDDQLIARFIDGAFRRLEGRAPTADEVSRWQATITEGSRLDLANALVHGERFSGSLIDDLYQKALGRRADGVGRAYWVATMAGGLKYEHLGTLFYGSQEYRNRSGGTSAGLVDALYRDILHRAPDDAGRRYWIELLDGGRANPDDVANAFYRSIESRRDRARAAHLRVLGADPGASQVERSAERLLVVDDLTLSAELALDLDLD